MMRLCGTVAVIYLALYVNVALGALVHKHNLNHETTAATFLVNQKDGGEGDAKAMELSDSIQGLFDPSTLPADSTHASPAMGSSKAVVSAKNAAKKDAQPKQASGPKVLAKRMQQMVAQAKREESVPATKASKVKEEKEVSGVLTKKLKDFVTKAQKVGKPTFGRKAVGKLPDVQHAAVDKKVSKLVALKTNMVQAKHGATTKMPEVPHDSHPIEEQKKASKPAKIANQENMVQANQEQNDANKAPQHRGSEGAHVVMMPSKLEAKSKEQTLSVSPKLAPVAMNLAKLPKPLQASGSFAATIGPLKNAPMLAKIPVAGKPVHPGGPVPVTKLQVAEKASVGSDSNKNTKFSWFPFSHGSNSSSSNSSVSVKSGNATMDNATVFSHVSSWLKNTVVFSHASNSSVSNGTVLQNSSVLVKSGNATMVNATKDNTPKEIEKEKEVEALPFGSFAMGLSDDPAQNKTEQPPQNKSTPTVMNATERAALKAAGVKKAAEKAAWEQRERVLREEITLLKARLENDTLEIKRHHLDDDKDDKSPPAAGTFNSHPKNLVDDDAPVKKPEPMEPLIKDDKPKADWPSMKSVAAPVMVYHVNSSEVPPQKEAMEAQAGDSNKVGLNTAFTGTPTKKVQSVMALDSTVQHDAVSTDAPNDDSFAPVENATPVSFSVWNSIASFFSRMFAVRPETPVPVQHVAAPRKVVTALLDTTQRRVGPQDYDKTAQATREEASHVLATTGVWGELEEEDQKEEDIVRGEDQSERVRARTPESPHAESKEELSGRHGTDMSRFWSNLETEDGEIEKSVTSENLGEYQRLTQDQDEKVEKADNQLQESKLHTDREYPLKHNDNSFLSKTIHEPWLALENKDKVMEQRIHASPDLQMLQLKDSFRDSFHHH